jgi:hypothetical protein
MKSVACELATEAHQGVEAVALPATTVQPHPAGHSIGAP